MADRQTTILQRIYDGAPVAEAIELPSGTIEGIRDRAQVLFETGKWMGCLDALKLLERLGAPGPFDALMRAHCHQHLGHAVEAEQWAETAREVLGQLDAALGEGNAPR